MGYCTHRFEFITEPLSYELLTTTTTKEFRRDFYWQESALTHCSTAKPALACPVLASATARVFDLLVILWFWQWGRKDLLVHSLPFLCSECSAMGMGQFPICKLKCDLLRTSVTACTHCKYFCCNRYDFLLYLIPRCTQDVLLTTNCFIQQIAVLWLKYI